MKPGMRGTRFGWPEMYVFGVILCTIFFVACGACATIRNGSTDAERAAAQVGRDVAGRYAAAVSVEVNCGGLTVGRGSGVIVSTRHVLTAWHVADSTEATALGLPCVLLAKTSTGVPMLMRVQAVLPVVDIARLELVPDWPVEFDLPAPQIAGPLPAIGTIVCAATVVPVVRHKCGEVQPNGPAAEPHDLKFSAIIEPGNSGSGLYDEEGRLVGIVTVLRPGSNGQWLEGGASSLTSRAWLVSP